MPAKSAILSAHSSCYSGSLGLVAAECEILNHFVNEEVYLISSKKVKDGHVREVEFSLSHFAKLGTVFFQIRGTEFSTLSNTV